jgi:predicted RNase H-like nuclease (RuvC/YqgF family)
MSSDEESRKDVGEKNEAGAEWKLSWKRFLDYAKNLFDLERSIASLKAKNKEIRKELQNLQRQLDTMNGEVKALSKFISGAIEDKIDAKVEKAEIRAFERLISMVRGSSRDIE